MPRNLVRVRQGEFLRRFDDRELEHEDLMLQPESQRQRASLEHGHVLHGGAIGK